MGIIKNRYVQLALACVGFWVVGVLIMACGLIVAGGDFFDSFGYLFYDLRILIVYFTLISFPFLIYRQIFSHPIERYLEKYSKEIFLGSVGIVSLIVLVMFIVNGVGGFEVRKTLLMLTIPVPMVLYLISDYHSEKDGDLTNGQKFFQHIFIPAICFCISWFVFGLFVQSTKNGANISYSELSILLFPISIIVAYYYLDRKNISAYLNLIIFILIFGFPIIFGLGVYESDILWIKRFFVALILTLVVGVAEVIKYSYSFETEADAVGGTNEVATYFRNGTNWSTVVFPMIFMLVPALLLDMRPLPIWIFFGISILFWYTVGSSLASKSSSVATAISLIFGYGALAVVGYSMSDPSTSQNSTAISLEITFFGLLAMVGFSGGLLRLTKDMFGLKLDKFIMNIWTLDIYKYKISTLMLLVFSTLIVSLILTVAWYLLVTFSGSSGIGSGGQMATGSNSELIKIYADRLIGASVSITIVAMLAVFATFTRGRLKLVGNEVQGIEKLSLDECVVERRINSLDRANNFVVSGRLGVSWIAGLIAAFAVWVETGEIAISLYSFTTMTLLTMCGFVFNDLYDYEKDKLAGVNRPIASDVYSKREAFVVSLTISFMTSLFVALYMPRPAFVVWVVTLCGLVLYSPFSRRIPFAKGIFTAALTLAPFLYGSFVANSTLSAITMAVLFSFIFFRENILDSTDQFGDLASDVKTLSYYLGQEKTIQYSWIGLFLSGVVLLAISNSFSSVLLIVGGLLVLCHAVWIFRFDQIRGMRKTRAAIALGGISALM